MIRSATVDDVEEIARVYERSFATLDFLPVLHTLDEYRVWFAKQLTEHEGWVWDEEGVRGFIVLTEGELLYLYLDVGWTGRSIGSALLDHTKQRRPDGFTLWTFQQNAGARRFYERHGLTAIEFTEGERNEEKTPDVRYEWKPTA
jgi:ribosomal protein S18 acetylase RimI-like enzyme